jgi:cytochrome bd-type quinol oxidase subunit 2
MGRKQALYGGIALQILAALYIAIYLSITANTAEGAESADEKRAGVGAVAMVFIQGTSWCVLQCRVVVQHKHRSSAATSADIR